MERFDELQACMILNDQSKYTVDYIIVSFLIGLSELQSFINMLSPRTLEQTIELGKKQIITLEAIFKRMRVPAKIYHNQGSNYRNSEPIHPQVQAKGKPSNTLKAPTKLLTTSEMAARQENGALLQL